MCSDVDTPGDFAQTSRAKAMLSAESLHQLPDARQNRLDALLTDHGNVQDDTAGKRLCCIHQFP
jgi:hypothetical protein